MTAHINSFVYLLVASWFPSNEYLCGQIFKSLLPMRHANKCLFRCALLLTASSLTCLDRFLKALGNSQSTLSIAKENWVKYHGQNFSGRRCTLSAMFKINFKEANLFISESKEEGIEHGKGKKKKKKIITLVLPAEGLYFSAH